MAPAALRRHFSSSETLSIYKIWSLFFAALVLFGLSSCVTVPPQTAPTQKTTAGRNTAMSFEEHLRLGGIYESNGNLRPALREYERARDMRPGDGRSYFGIANVQLRLGSPGDAEDGYKKAIELDPSTGVYFNNLAWVYIKMQRYTDAYSMATRGAALDPRRPYIYLDTIGVVEMRLGNLSRAEQKLKEAAALMPPANRAGLLSVYENLRELYTMMNSRTDDIVEIERRIGELKGSMGSSVPMLP